MDISDQSLEVGAELVYVEDRQAAACRRYGDFASARPVAHLRYGARRGELFVSPGRSGTATRRRR